MDWILIMYLISDEIAVRFYATESQCIEAITGLRTNGGGDVEINTGEVVRIVWAVCAPGEVALDGPARQPGS